MSHSTKSLDHTGARVWNLTILGKADIPRGKGVRWRALCDCGRETTVIWATVVCGSQKSCGCGIAKRRHGMWNTPEHSVWSSMRARCFNPRDTGFKNYGGRGITVCERWNDFACFFKDMGPRPPGTSIDRINVNGNYEPGNCRWATDKEQNRNMRSNHWLEFNGERYTLPEWAERSGVPYKTLAERIRKGWPTPLALTVPLRRHHLKFAREKQDGR